MSKELFDAIESNDLAKIQELIEAGINLEIKNLQDNTPLLYAIKKKRTEIATLLIEKGADVNAKDSNGDTPLIVASQKGNKEIVSLLIEKVIDINAKNDFEYTPLITAIENGRTEIVALLIEKGVDVNDGNGRIPILAASHSGHTDVAALLIEKGADVNVRSFFGYTPLRIALEEGHTDLAALLIEKGANVNDKYKEGYQPLIIALEEGHTDLAALLIEKGADVNDKNKEGYQPLIIALERGYTNLAALLIEKGADLNAKNKSGHVPLTTALKRGYTNIAAILIEEGAQVDINNEQFRHLIINEINQGDARLLKVVLNKGINIFDDKIFEEEVQHAALINDNNEVLFLFPNLPKSLTLSQKLEYKINSALDKSPNQRKYPALVNVMHNAGIKLPDNLRKYVNSITVNPNLSETDKTYFKHNISMLANYYTTEAMYKDMPTIGEKFRIGKNHPVMEEVKTKLNILYDGNSSREDFTKAAEDLKVILLRERVKHALPEGTDTYNFNKIIKQGIRQNLPAAEICASLQTALIERGFEIDDHKLNRMCSNFVILRPIQDQASLHKRITQNILNQLNEDFRVEMGAALDLEHTKLTGNELLYRGMNVNFSYKEIKELFELGHRRLEGKNDLFLYEMETKWNQGRSGQWAGNMVYTSTDPDLSAGFVNNGILMEIRPKPDTISIYGKNEWESEVLFNQLPHDDIKLVYKIDNKVVTGIFKNPYYEKRENEPDLTFKLGDDIEIKATKFAQKGKEEYQKIKFNRYGDKYSSRGDFEGKYGPKEVEASRQRLWDERGYRTYKEKFEQLPKENWPAVISKGPIIMSQISKQLYDREPDPISESFANSAERRNSGFLFDTIKMAREYISNTEAPKAERNTWQFTSTPSELTKSAFNLPITLRDQYNLAKVMYQLGKDTVSYCTDLFKDLNSEKIPQKQKEQLVQTLEKQLNQVAKTLEAIDKKLDHAQINIEEELQSYKQQSNGLLDKISKDKPIHKWLENKVKEQKHDINNDKKKLKVKTDKAIDIKFDHMKLEDKLAKLKETGELSKHSYDKIRQAKNKLIDSVKGLKDETSKPGKKPNGKEKLPNKRG
jgi:ankyrin repeat protein